MRYISQTLLGPDEGYPRSGAIPGNCVQAAVASLLSLDLLAVPHVALFDDWQAALRLWASPYGWDLIVQRPDQMVVADRSPLVILLGRSHRESSHAVVGRPDGTLVWDPHPSRAGLIEVRLIADIFPRLTPIQPSEGPDP